MAAKTWQSIITEARAILQDTATGEYRYTDPVLLNTLNRGVQELARLRPDAFLDRFLEDDIIVPQVVAADSNPTDPETPLEVDEDSEVALTDTFDLPMEFHGALVYWVVATAEFTDDEFTNDGRAATLLGLFKQQLVGM